MKDYHHQGRRLPLYFWRDSKGVEVDLLIDEPQQLKAVEIKSGTTVTSDYFANLEKFRNLTGEHLNLFVLYGGQDASTRKGINLLPWHVKDEVDGNN